MADDPTTTTTTTPPTGGTTTTTTPPAAGSGDDVAALRAQLEAAQKAAAEGTAAQAELARIRAEREAAEKKQLEEQGQWRELAERNKGEAKALQGRILTERVRSTALAQGLIDPALVSMITTDDSFLVNGEPDQGKIDKAVADFKAAKAHFFKAATATTTGAGTSPPASTDTRPKHDFQKATSRADADKLFEQAKRDLRR